MELRVGGGMELSFDNSNLTPHGETTPPEYANHGCGGECDKWANAVAAGVREPDQDDEE